MPEDNIIKFRNKGYELKIDELGGLLRIKNISGINLLKESEEKLNSIKRELLKEGNRALGGQEDIVEDLRVDIQKIIKNKIKNDANLNSTELYKQYENDAENLYISKTEKKWETERRKLNMANKYVKLFNNTKKKIRDIITPDFFKKLKEEVKIQKIQVVKKPSEPTDNKVTSGGGPEMTGGGGGGSGGGTGGGIGPGSGDGREILFKMTVYKDYSLEIEDHRSEQGFNYTGKIESKEEQKALKSIIGNFLNPLKQLLNIFKKDK